MWVGGWEWWVGMVGRRVGARVCVCVGWGEEGGKKVETFAKFISAFSQIVPSNVENMCEITGRARSMASTTPGPQRKKDLKNIRPLQDRGGRGVFSLYLKCKGRFQCPGCGKRWTSASASLKVYIRVWTERGKIAMECFVRKFKQSCNSCKGGKFVKFQLSDYETERLARIILVQAGVLRRSETRQEQQGSSMQSTHVAAHCEACSLGECPWGRN